LAAGTGAPEITGGRRHTDAGKGHMLPSHSRGCSMPVSDARKRGIILQQYIQSIIYVSGSPPRTPRARGVIHDERKGTSPCPMVAAGSHLLSRCRATGLVAGTRDRGSPRGLGDMGPFRRSTSISFGKGATEGFAADQGHPVGGEEGKHNGGRSAGSWHGGSRSSRENTRRSVRRDPIEAFRICSK